MSAAATAKGPAEPPRFTIRPASLAAHDEALLIDLKDSHLAWLSSVGSSGQWGSKPSREANPAIVDKTRAWVAGSERQDPWGAEWCRAFVAETVSPVKSSSTPVSDPASASASTSTTSATATAAATSETIPVAALVLESTSAAYTRPAIAEQDERDPFVWLSYLITNRHAGDAGKGAGAALIALAKEQTRSVGLARICLDCYGGNDRKLAKYYESQGFTLLGEFTACRDEYDSTGEKIKWPGCVMEMRL